MNHLFLNKELSLLAKEKGFNQQCLAAYIKGTLKGCGLINFQTDGTFNNWGAGNEEQPWIAAPLYQQIIDFFIKKEISIDVFPFELNKWAFLIEKIGVEGFTRENGELRKVPRNINTPSCLGNALFDSRNLALDKAIEETFELI